MDGSVYLVSHGGREEKLLALLGSQRERVVNGRDWEVDWLSINRLTWAHGSKDAGDASALVLDVFGVRLATIVFRGNKEGVVVRGVVGV